MHVCAYLYETVDESQVRSLGVYSSTKATLDETLSQ